MANKTFTHSTIDKLSSISQWVEVFGVRHLSPMGAWHLQQTLDRVRPTAVLIEGLADAEALIDDIVRRDTHPPIAILAYTDAQPVRTLVYPLARYSPEYQALRWAREHDVFAKFIDLPSDVFLALQTSRDSNPATEKDYEPKTDSKIEAVEVDVSNRRILYDQIASNTGESDYDTYWERNFEHNQCEDSYRLGVYELGRGLRELDADRPLGIAENLIRESYMRRCIHEAIAEGHAPNKIVVIVGAYHSTALLPELGVLSDDELASLKRLTSKLTLMPYSYFKLSSQSGYGAGNQAPAYFELLWEALQNDKLSSVPTRYLAMIARHMRQTGTHRSTAEVIEGVRLANTLSALKNGLAPTLQDLQDSAIALLGHGDRASVQEALARVEVGTAIGVLPAGVSQTSIQEDFSRELKRLNLDKYRQAVKQDFSLDLRENRQAKTEQAAFIDLNRSAFLHRLQLLGVPFAVPTATRQESATWAESWHLQWSPESEIALVESVLLGETIEIAAAFRFKMLLDESKTIDEAAKAVDVACKCGMFDSLQLAQNRLQDLAAQSSEFVAVAHAAHQLLQIIRYGDVRKFDPTPLIPLVEQLFVQGALALFAAANCSDDAAREMVVGIEEMNQLASEFHDSLDESMWVDELQRLSNSDDRNPLLSGYACSILLERQMLDSDLLAREVSRRLSPGIPSDLGAGWFEGMSLRNRYALIARQALWTQLADYVQQLDDEQFKRALVFLRRAFGNFSPAEKRAIAENLGEVWGVGADQVSELINQPMTDAEEQAIDELNDFDFGDF